MTNMAWCHPPWVRLKHAVPLQGPLQGHTLFFNHPSMTHLKYTIPLQSPLQGLALFFNHSGGQSGLVGKWL